MGNFKDMAGIRFGMLVADKKLDRDGGGFDWECVCDCGKVRVVYGGHLRTGKVKSCGCHIWHGHAKTKTREYISYHNMMARCCKESNKRYKDYGAKGILVSDDWKLSFKNFIRDMGECPENYQIDRIDNEQGYSKENCRWASRKENMRNKGNSYNWILFGATYPTAKEASENFNVSENTISAWCIGRKVGTKFYPPKESCSRVGVYL